VSWRAGEAKPLAGVRAWIVDDNDTNRRILRRQLEEWGLQVRDTGRPAEAVEWAQRGDACDLAILDFHMPGMNGLELARALNGLRGGALKQVLLTSGLPVPDADARPAGLLAQLSKPVKHAPLYNLIVRLFERRAAPPAAPAQGDAAAAPGAPADPKALRILIVEDNPINVYLLTILLERMGCRADVANNGALALDALRRAPYDVVFMDVQMPVMDGIEATRRIRQDWPPERRPRIIALTAGVMADEVQTCKDAGMDDFIAKPIDVASLAASLARCTRLDPA